MSTILVTGGSGLVGSYLKNKLPDATYLSSKDYDLTKESEVIKMYSDHKPETVIHLAAKVGGILDNIHKPADYFLDNIKMNTFLIDHAYKTKVSRFIAILSSCIYPDTAKKYPLEEKDLHAGPPTETNFSYGYAKRAMAVQIEAYNKQYNTQYQYLIPCNLFGSGDKDEEEKSHFVTALIKKIIIAKLENKSYITLYGDGSPLRQFLHASDFANILSLVIKNNILESFNVCGHETLTVKEIAALALSACDSGHFNIVWDSSKPNGQLRKDMSLEKFKQLFPEYTFTTLFDGIKDTYNIEYDKFSKRHCR